MKEIGGLFTTGGEAQEKEKPFDINEFLANRRPVTKESLRGLADYLTSGFWKHYDTNIDDAPSGEGREFTYNTGALTQDRAKTARIALENWSDVANVTFREVEGRADIVFTEFSPSTNKEAVREKYSNLLGNYIEEVPADFFNKQAITHGFAWEENGAWVNIPAKIPGQNLDFIPYAIDNNFFTHEIGHALGLGHPGPYNGRSLTFGIDNLFPNDSYQISIMSYFNQEDAGVGSDLFPLGPQMADILASQSFYGEAVKRTGDDIYKFEADFSFLIYDSGGIDTLDASGYEDDQTIDLRGGTFSDARGWKGNIGIYFDTVIEIAKGGGGNDDIVGNATRNGIVGNGGDDIIHGIGGSDDLLGDDVSWSAVGGDDALYGGDGDDILYGMGGNDILEGGEGADKLLGFAGNDKLTGGEGADCFIFENYQAVAISVWGDDIVTDFKQGVDKIEFQGDAGPVDFDALEINRAVDSRQDSPGGTRIAFGDDTILLQDFYGTLNPDDFNFPNATPAIA